MEPNNDKLIDSAARLLALVEEVLDAGDGGGEVTIESGEHTQEWWDEAQELVAYIREDDEDAADELPIYTVTVACDLAAYGTAEVQAGSWEEALVKAQAIAEMIVAEPEWMTAAPNHIIRIEDEDGEAREVSEEGNYVITMQP